ncbi:hypothetical protein [Botrimarina mediterranea]|uniref:Helix-turn-helix domain protein n=1 Tax=Botrimarina mediterranea TaxID=2528022 RepID=A0A518KC87_9BACT|nr:hypothetical protein [Botrimarina mediterranea]QDV75404.1 hypothetical protein Spa11_36210 [Botrimarina mediterranea]
MAKSKPAAVPPLKHLYRITPAAAAVQVSRQTLHSAVGLGYVASYTLGDGLPLVDLREVKRWKEETHRPHSC